MSGSSSTDRIYTNTYTASASHPSIHHHPFYYLPAWDDAMQRLIFVSHRTGTPQIFAEICATAELQQLTDRHDLNEWSIHPSHDGRFVYFTAGSGAWRVDTSSLAEERLSSFGSEKIREEGMVGAAMGTTTLSRDDRWWAVPVKAGDVAQFHLIETATGKDEIILERDTIGHPQFHPDDPTWLRYGGPYHSRIWTIRSDGTDNRLVYERNAAKKEWIVHETWRPGTMEILTANWPLGVIGIDVLTGKVRNVCSFNAWHPMIDRVGTCMVADTKNPDIGLQIFDIMDGIGKPIQLCESEASSAGDHWNLGHCPYDDGPIEVFAPQHTHPHPNFSPDGTRVVFTSDCTGQAQLYECELLS
ncbi:MAG: oligogalacturonate lyase family protein [Verrucomicrobiota bacterium]